MNAFTSLRISIADNGLGWTSLHVARRMARWVSAPLAARIDARMKRLETRLDLPGEYSVARNYTRWNEWDWSRRGEEWTPSEEWKRSLVDHVLLEYIRPGGTVLEIGPGSGRWSETLARISRRLILVDLSDECIRRCRQRFASATNIEYFVNDGSDLRFLEPESLDHVWSFDVFVHIAPAETERYLAGIARALRTGGLGVIHHPKSGGGRGGWRSRTDGDRFAAFVAKSGMTVVRQFEEWGTDQKFDVRGHGDLITVFRK